MCWPGAIEDGTVNEPCAAPAWFAVMVPSSTGWLCRYTVRTSPAGIPLTPTPISPPGPVDDSVVSPAGAVGGVDVGAVVVGDVVVGEVVVEDVVVEVVEVGAVVVGEVVIGFV